MQGGAQQRAEMHGEHQDGASGQCAAQESASRPVYKLIWMHWEGAGLHGDHQLSIPKQPRGAHPPLAASHAEGQRCFLPLSDSARAQPCCHTMLQMHFPSLLFMGDLRKSHSPFHIHLCFRSFSLLCHALLLISCLLSMRTQTLVSHLQTPLLISFQIEEW